MPSITTDIVATDARDEWVRVVNELVEQVSAWAREEPGWEVLSPTQMGIDEAPLGEYIVPVLTINTPEGRLVLEPISRNWGGQGMVEFYAWPTLRRVHFLHDVLTGSWLVWTDSGIPLRQEWNRSNFITLSRDLLASRL